jgi:hypothetical protein
MSNRIPENESERLNTLRGYGILDTHAEEEIVFWGSAMYLTLRG